MSRAQTSDPVDVDKQYTIPASDPTNMAFPSADRAGEDLMEPAAVKVHETTPVLPTKLYTAELSFPTYTRPSEPTTGDDWKCPDEG